MMWIKQLFCRHKPEWTLRPPTTRLYGDPNYDGWVCKKCGKEVWKGRGYINFTATQLKRYHEIWMSKPVPDYVPACEDPVWHGMFEDLWKSNIEYAANAALKRKVCKHPLGGTAWGATIPIHKEKKMEFKIGDKVRHECGVEGIVEGVGTPSLLVRVTTKNVYNSGSVHEWAENLVTKLPEPEPAPHPNVHPNVGDRMQFRGEIAARPDSPRDSCWTVKLDGSNGAHTRISQSEMRSATRVEPQMHQAACEAYNDLLKSQNNHLIAENEKVKREFSFNVENHTNARKEIDKLREELKLANQKLEEARSLRARAERMERELERMLGERILLAARIKKLETLEALAYHAPGDRRWLLPGTLPRFDPARGESHQLLSTSMAKGEGMKKKKAWKVAFRAEQVMFQRAAAQVGALQEAARHRKYHCGTCGFECEDSVVMIEHHKTDHPVPAYRCAECGFMGDTHAEMAKHWEEAKHDDEVTSYSRCAYCRLVIHEDPGGLKMQAHIVNDCEKHPLGIRIRHLEAESQEFYHADGSFEKLASKEEVVARRISCAVRIEELEDLLSSAYAIAERKGRGTAWERYAKQLALAGISPVTAKTFRVLPSDSEPDNSTQGGHDAGK
jgi:DNA-directed RNA polymerase subunit RPC12/RpoP